MIHEKTVKPFSGYLFIGLVALAITLAVLSVTVVKLPILLVLLLLLVVFLASGFFIVNPNSSKVLVLFGKYVGTVKSFGFYWANPFFIKKKISLRARNLDGDKIKVNDQLGNPIVIAAVIVWRVSDTAKAAFEVNDYERYMQIQSDAAVRNLAGAYAYDNFDDEEADITLRSGGEMVDEMLEGKLAERVAMAGIEIIEARISHLAYAEEIAGAMLQRQQATAIVAARIKIVEGAVGMVEMALEKLNEKSIVELDEERKAAMVSNLMVVLCGDKNAQPIVNTGTLY